MDASRKAPAAVILAALVALGATACNAEVQGDGVLREEDRTGRLSLFDGIAVKDGVQVKATAGGDLRVVVSGDENVVQHVQTQVRTDVALGVQYLDVSVTTSYVSTHPLLVTVTVPELRLLRVADATQVEARSVAAQRFRVEATDGSDVFLAGAGTGAAPALDVVLSAGQHGGAHLDARSYPVVTASVDLGGASRAEVQASGAVTGTAVPPSRVENSGAGACQVQDGQGAAVSCAVTP